jgi:hypothetical protein
VARLLVYSRVDGIRQGLRSHFSGPVPVMRSSGLASSLALAVRPAALAEAPESRVCQKDAPWARP